MEKPTRKASATTVRSLLPRSRMMKTRADAEAGEDQGERDDHDITHAIDYFTPIERPVGTRSPRFTHDADAEARHRDRRTAGALAIWATCIARLLATAARGRRRKRCNPGWRSPRERVADDASMPHALSDPAEAWSGAIACGCRGAWMPDHAVYLDNRPSEWPARFLRADVVAASKSPTGRRGGHGQSGLDRRAPMDDRVAHRAVHDIPRGRDRGDRRGARGGATAARTRAAGTERRLNGRSGRISTSTAYARASGHDAAEPDPATGCGYGSRCQRDRKRHPGRRPTACCATGPTVAARCKARSIVTTAMRSSGSRSPRPSPGFSCSICSDPFVVFQHGRSHVPASSLEAGVR